MARRKLRTLARLGIPAEFWRDCIWDMRRCWALRPPPEPKVLNILRIWAYWRRRLLTAWTVVPEPRAMAANLEPQSLQSEWRTAVTFTAIRTSPIEIELKLEAR